MEAMEYIEAILITPFLEIACSIEETGIYAKRVEATSATVSKSAR